MNHDMRRTPRTTEIFTDLQRRVYVRTDRMMLVILFAQWIVAVAIAIWASPYTWAGRIPSLHIHLKMALALGGILNALPALLAHLRPGAAVTRHVIAAAQMLWSALLIHLTGGRIETHFHVFGSLAFLAFYRDWRVIATATLVVVADHLGRGLLVPESVYGVVDPEWWRFLEHAVWVVFEDVVLILGCTRQVSEMLGIARREAELESVNRQIEQKVVERTAELEAERKRYQSLVEGTNVVPWEIDTELGRMVYVGPQISSLGYTADELRGADFWKECVHPDDRPRYAAELARAIADEVDCALEYRLVAKDGSHVHVRDVVSARARDGSGRRVVRGIAIDVSERKKLESELAQAQKLEAVGQLAAGIAHEINTPVQFVNDSVQFVREACGGVSELVRKYQTLRAAVERGSDASALAAELRSDENEKDLDFLLENVPKALDLSMEGLGRVTNIVRSMKVFAHPDGDEADADLNEGLRSTLTIARNEYKDVADVETDLGHLPLIRCRFGELNQVFLNLIVNAAHAIAEAAEGTGRRGKIFVRSRAEAQHVTVAITDDGPGIPEAVRDKIFDQFFTTKPVGKGTGQGLSIARSVIERHGGKLTFTSELGRGTTFTVALPTHSPDALAA